MQELVDRSGLDLDQSSVRRKLEGKLRMTVDEAQALGRPMKRKLVWAP